MISVYHKIELENQKKTRENMEMKVDVHKFPHNRWYRNGIHSLLRRAGARGSADIITVCDAYHY